MRKTEKILSVVTAIGILLSGCGSSSETSVKTGTDSTAGKAAPVELTAGSAVYTDKHPLSEAQLGDNRTWINDDPEYAQLISTLKLDNRNNDGMIGVYLVATDDDILYFFASDEYERDGSTKLNEYSTFEIASNTKTFTATAIFQLIERGQLSLDDKLGKFFPDYENGKDITIYQMLHMRSGIYDDVNEPSEFFGTDDRAELNKLLKRLWMDEMDDEEYLGYIYKAPLKSEPGTTFSYSNTTYALLAMIIEQVTGMSYKDYVQKNIFDVCGMEHTSSMGVGDVTTVPTEQGANYDEYADMLVDGYTVAPNHDRGVGDIHSCAADMLAFDRALKNGKLVNEDSLAEMFRIENGYSCGIMEFSMNKYGHTGGLPNYFSDNFFIDTKVGNVYIIKLTHT